MSAATETKNTGQYHSVPAWRIALFSLNNTATNIYLFAFNFLSFYAVGYLGIIMSAFGSLFGAVRLFDGLIDPTIGIIIDKVDSKFGRFRPIMVVGNIILILSFLMLFNLHNIENQTLRLGLFVFVLLFHKIGYSLQQTVTKAAQPVLTNDPSQRPMFSIFDNIFSSILIFTLGQVFVTNYLQPKHGDFNLGYFNELTTIVMIVSAICTVLAAIALAPKDIPEYYGSLDTEEDNSGTLKSVWRIIKSNRPLQLLALAAGLVKFVSTTVGDQILLVLLFGITLANYQALGTLGVVVSVVSFIAIPIMSSLAAKKDLRWAYTTGALVAIAGFITMLALILTAGDTTQIFAGGWGMTTIIFTVGYVLVRVFMNYLASLSLTMAADITDYEMAQSGTFASGLIGTVFSLTDSIASSLAPIISSFIAAGVGYVTTTPEVGDALTSGILRGTIAGYMGIPAVILLIVLVLIRLYPLDRNTMAEVQAKIESRKEARAK